MLLVIYGQGGGHAHTHKHAQIHARMKVISRNQARLVISTSPL